MSDNPGAVVERLLTVFDRAGWEVIVVAHDDGSRFAYTVGLTLKRLPELCTTCTAADDVVSMLNELAEQHIDAGGFGPGQATHVAGRSVRLDRHPELEQMYLVRELFGGNTPAPAALAVTVLD